MAPNRCSFFLGVETSIDCTFGTNEYSILIYIYIFTVNECGRIHVVLVVFGVETPITSTVDISTMNPSLSIVLVDLSTKGLCLISMD